MKTPTPRTDATVTGNSSPTQDEYEDLADFARTLERELATEQERLDTLIKHGFVVHEDEHSKFAVFCPNIGDYITSWLLNPRAAIDVAIQKLNSD